jgi:hypothetical protein
MQLILQLQNWLAGFGLIEGRRYCTVCKRWEHDVGHLSLCTTVVDKRTAYKEQNGTYCTLSPACLTLPLVCARCNNRIRRLRQNVQIVEAEYRMEEGKIVGMRVIARGTKQSFRYKDPNTREMVVITVIEDSNNW